MQPFDEVDVDAKISGTHRQDDCFIDLIADVTHHWNCNVMDIGLPPTNICKANERKSETAFPTLRVEFAQIAFDKAAEHSKYCRFGQPYRGHNLRQGELRTRVSKDR